MNIFEAVKDGVTTRQAAEMYGIQIRRGMACCPFHNDKTPSMKIDKRFHCFGCQADGDVINFVARLYGLSNKDAAIKLAADFGISYDRRTQTTPPSTKKRIPEEVLFQRTLDRIYRVYSDYLCLLRRWKTQFAPKSPEDEDWHSLFVEALQRETYIEYLLDTMLSGTVQEQAECIVQCSKEVDALEKRIKEFTG